MTVANRHRTKHFVAVVSRLWFWSARSDGEVGQEASVLIELEGETHREVHDYALEIAKRMVRRQPDKYTTAAGVKNRVGKLFIDCLRNRRGDTAVGAYSPRAREGLTFARPVTWDEVENGIRPDAFTITMGRPKRKAA